MMFSRKKPGNKPGSSPHVLRSRDQAAEGGPENPLARRFLQDDEPDTIDLEDPGRFHAGEAGAEPSTTRSLDEAGSASEDSDEQQRVQKQGLISRDARTGKFYVHPGDDQTPVLLDGQPVVSTTELRSGDTITIGEANFKFL